MLDVNIVERDIIVDIENIISYCNAKIFALNTGTLKRRAFIIDAFQEVKAKAAQVGNYIAWERRAKNNG